VIGPTLPPAAVPRVLVVDDMDDCAQTVAELLRDQGFEVRTAGSALAALSAAGDFRPDLVVLDIGLPGMSGWDIAPVLREQGAVVLALSGYGMQAARHMSLEAGCVEHLLKPARPEELTAAVVRHLPRQAVSAPPR
jgi:DNA-binding response OmpR family regulator